MEREIAKGRVLGERFRLAEPFGRDVFGELWTAQDLRDGRAVWVRAIEPEIGIAPGSSSEVLALARSGLRHPNLAAVLDVVCEDGRWFLVNERAEGESLAKLITARGALSPTDAFKLAIDLGEGLRALHAAGAIHGRLDPTRVVMLGDTAKIFDVGLGMLLGDDSEEWRTTIPDLNDPTVAFLSPEQAAGDGAPTAESDVWALGAVVYFAMFAAVPYAARTRAELAVATARRLASLERARDRSLAALIAPCLSREPALRPWLGEFLEDARAGYEPSLGAVRENSTPGASFSIPAAESFRPMIVVTLSERVPRPAMFAAIFAVFLLIGLAVRGGDRIPPPPPTNAGLPALATELPRPLAIQPMAVSASASASAIPLSAAGTVAH